MAPARSGLRGALALSCLALALGARPSRQDLSAKQALVAQQGLAAEADEGLRRRGGSEALGTVENPCAPIMASINSGGCLEAIPPTAQRKGTGRVAVVYNATQALYIQCCGAAKAQTFLSKAASLVVKAAKKTAKVVKGAARVLRSRAGVLGSLKALKIGVGVGLIVLGLVCPMSLPAVLAIGLAVNVAFSGMESYLAVRNGATVSEAAGMFMFNIVKGSVSMVVGLPFDEVAVGVTKDAVDLLCTAAADFAGVKTLADAEVARGLEAVREQAGIAELKDVLEHAEQSVDDNDVQKLETKPEESDEQVEANGGKARKGSVLGGLRDEAVGYISCFKGTRSAIKSAITSSLTRVKARLGYAGNTDVETAELTGE